MISIIDNDIRRGTEKIGWYEENRIYNHEGKKLGYFLDNRIYNTDGDKIAYLQNDYVYAEDGSRKLRIEDVCEDVSGGTLSNVGRAAIRLFLGD